MDVSPWCWLTLGALLGWMLHWLLDWWKLSGVFSAHRNNIGTLETRVSNLSADLDASRQRLDVRNSAFSSLETETVDLRARIGAIPQLEADLADLRVKLSDADAVRVKLGTLETEAQGLRAKLGAAEGFETKFNDANTELEGLRGKLAELDALRANLKVAEDNRKRVEGELSELRGSSKRELNDLAIKLSDAEAAQEKLKASLDVSVRELGELRAKEREFDGIKQELASAQNAHGEAQGLLGARDDELGRLRAELAAAQESSDRLAGFEPELATLRARVGELDRERDEALASVRARDQELEGLRRQTGDLDALRAELEAARNAKSDADRERDEARGSIGQLEGRLRELETQTKRIPDLEAAANRVNALEARANLVPDLEKQVSRIAGLETQVSGIAGLEGRIRDLEPRANQVAGLEARIKELEAQTSQIAGLESRIKELEPKANQVSGLEGRIRDLEPRANQVSGLEAEIARLNEELNRVRSQRRDDLTKINGIGAVFATRLNDAGIRTFAELEQSNASRILEIIKPEDWQKIDPDLWRSEAGYYARGEKPPKREKAPDRLAKVNGIGDVYERKLQDAGIRSFADLAAASPARLTEITGASETEANLWITEADALAHGKRGTRDRERLVRGKLSSAEEELARLRAELARRPEGARRDLFEDLPVIGEAYQRRLYGAGIFTFEELAALTPERLHEIIGVDNLDYALVIREAGKAARGEAFGEAGGRRRRAQRDSLERINGIGVVYQRKLFAAGINTFEDLVAAGPDKPYDVLENDLEFGPWIEEARGYAQSEAQYRDHLEKVDGIGRVYQERLFAAQVYTFEDLAALSDARISEIVQPGEREIHPDAWKREALELAKTSPKNLEDQA